MAIIQQSAPEPRARTAMARFRRAVMVPARVKPPVTEGRSRFLPISAAALAALLAFGCTFGPVCSQAWAGGDVTSGLPVPRFVSLKADRVTVRGGPDKDHDVAWIYTRAG